MRDSSGIDGLAAQSFHVHAWVGGRLAWGPQGAALWDADREGCVVHSRPGLQQEATCISKGLLHKAMWHVSILQDPTPDCTQGQQESHGTPGLFMRRRSRQPNLPGMGQRSVSELGRSSGSILSQIKDDLESDPPPAL